MYVFPTGLNKKEKKRKKNHTIKIMASANWWG
jgi:hypothetical protein